MSVPAQYLIDNEQKRAKYRRFNSKGEVNGLSFVERNIIPLAEAMPELADEEKSEIIEKPVVSIHENLRAHYFVPHLSRNGKSRLDNATGEQGLTLTIKYIKEADLEKYLELGEKFAAPKNGSIAHIIIDGIPAEYSGLPILVETDRILGFPDYNAEKLHSNSMK